MPYSVAQSCARLDKELIISETKVGLVAVPAGSFGRLMISFGKLVRSAAALSAIFSSLLDKRQDNGN